MWENYCGDCYDYDQKVKEKLENMNEEKLIQLWNDHNENECIYPMSEENLKEVLSGYTYSEILTFDIDPRDKYLVVRDEDIESTNNLRYALNINQLAEQHTEYLNNW